MDEGTTTWQHQNIPKKRTIVRRTEQENTTTTASRFDGKGRKRAYIGNLRHRSDLEERLRRLFSDSAISVNDIEINTARQLHRSISSSSSSSCYALVECDANMAIKCLDGIQFDGRTIKVQFEKKNDNQKKKHSMDRKDSTRENGVHGRVGNNKRGTGARFGSSGWSKPVNPVIGVTTSTRPRQQNSSTQQQQEQQQHQQHQQHQQQREKEEEDISSFSDAISNFVSQEMKETIGVNNGSDNHNDNDNLYNSIHEDDRQLNAAIASTTAVMALLSTTINDDSETQLLQPQSQQNEEHPLPKNIIEQEVVHNSCNSDFQSASKRLSISHLMADYGDQDTNFQKVNANTKKIQRNTNPKTKSKSKTNNTNTKNTSSITSTSNMLSPNGKAPVNVELVSFGYKYGAPSNASTGSWGHANPLPVIDCRNLPRAPHHVAKLSGLAFQAKRAMLNQSDADNPDHINNDNHDKNDSQGQTHSNNDSNEVTSEKTVQKEKQREDNKLKRTGNDTANKIFIALEDAINQGGHGYAFPLEMTIHVGSEYGRHRSVVLCELTAQNLRSLLRTNEHGKITQPVSITTRHRDIDLNHKDEEAFGMDLRREHDREVKRKKNLEW
eukprot:CAMPEP_0184861266 /NCGR_PEP_ID=MMETSP0580-20130426/5991_1 /TAXON_ID=1118495 /ORGANISM="Dactyliosolen fragilissimus" /LENGTH=609 /DNA_ID=CAMNT_0027358691 /DNA_START=28 /DNA_END=1854 /DNA_ORIENTATION=-